MESEKQQVSIKKVVNKRKQRNTDDEQWTDLPNELLELIKKRLFYTDQLNYLEVCKSWSCIKEEERLIPPLQQMPWLLVFGSDYCTLVDPKYKKAYKVDTKTINKRMNITTSYGYGSSHIKCHESKYGWLLISVEDRNSSNSASTTNNTALFLYSPFLDDENNNCIELPILSTGFCMATFTSNPLDDNCTVITLNTSCQVDAMVIKTYHPGRHSSSWDSQVFKCDQFSPSHVRCWTTYTDEGIFYYVIRDGRVGTFDLAREEWKVFPPLPTTMQATLRTLLCANWVTVYMMKSSEGELFLISECNLRNLQSSRWRYDGQYIYRLDLSSMIWKDLNNIGERVLFISNEYKAVLETKGGGRKEISNAIYCCSKWQLKYCTVHDYTLRNSNNGYPRRQLCITHYGYSAMNSGNKSLLIDPPLPRRPRW